MKKLIAAFSVAGLTALGTQSASAADFEAEQAIQNLVVSGVVESWAGYTFYSSVDVDSEDPDDGFASGRSGRLSLPLGPNLSIQMDVDNETNTDWLVDTDAGENTGVFQYSVQMLAHLSLRDPNTGLIGAFGGAGALASDGNTYDMNFFGGEAQLYLDDLTFYVQGGVLDSEGSDGDSTKDAAFGRGVIRWFTSADTRLQGEISYVDGTFDGDDDANIVEWAVRYDTVLALPVLGDTNLFAGYRGAKFENEDENDSYLDHTVMVGFRMAFGGNSLKEFDRIGATLDAPNFGRWVGAGNIAD